ncbi:MAG: anaerobic ribonucleoside-triphosphate reductase activating protein [Lachnospiraceae bacterium]|nr:anaerobic ribonucleoside-triphosphate reductase activating protein [Lachnospiraceae bacterium]
MHYAEIKTCDIANGPGIRVSLFVSGCTHRCQNCFNEETWNFQYGKPFTAETENELIDALRPAYIKGLTLLGGEPLEQSNQRGLLPFVRRVKKELPDKNIWCYTGYTFETDVLERMCTEWEETRELLSYFDVLVDGEFVQEKKDMGLQFRGSSNQRLIRVAESLREGKTVLWNGEQ